MPRQRPSNQTPKVAHTGLEAARATAVAHLARRDFASGELRHKLGVQGFDEVTVAVLIADLTREGLLDDARYANNYVASRAGRGQGPVRIGAELRRSGLADALIEAALAGGADWRALALKVRRAKYGPEPPVNWKQKARQARFLQYRGFSSDDIRAATGADSDQD
jgi:regulatory protein